MMNTTKILPSPQKIPHDLIESQTNRVTLLRRRFSRCQLEVSIEKNGHLRGWVTSGETREVKLKGLPAYLNLKQATQLLNQSYLKFQKEAITALPKGLGGGMKHSRPSAAFGSNKAETCEEEALQLVEAIPYYKEIREAVEEFLKNDPEKKVLNIRGCKIGDAGAQALGTALRVNQSLQSLNLEFAQIGAAGAKALGAALQVNQLLQILNLWYNQIGEVGVQALVDALQVNQSIQELTLYENQIDYTEIAEMDILLEENIQIASAFRKQVKEVKKFLKLHENDKGILWKHLPQLQVLLQKWHSDSQNIIPSIEESFKQSRKTDLNDRYREKLAAIITDFTNRLHELWLEAFEKKIVVLSNEYVMGKESSQERNVDLGRALYETWLTFLGSGCPNWLEHHLQSLLPFGVLLDIAEGGDKQDISELKDPHLLFQRVLLFRNGSKDSLFSLNDQFQKS